MPQKNQVIEELMKVTGIPGLSMATMKNGAIDFNVLGVTNCGFYKVSRLPDDKQKMKIDASRYLLTDEGLYFYNVATDQLETISNNEVILKNILKEVGKDPMYQKFDQIPALKASQLQHINKETKHQFQPQKINERTQFGAASLSKPVFFYLVLRIIEDEEIKKALKLKNFDLNTRLFDLLPGLAQRSEWAKDITIGMVLSHQTGVNDFSQDNNAPVILFKPGSQFSYSGFPLIYLQMALEKNTGKTLEQLAKAYVFEHVKMENSSFLKKGQEDFLPDYFSKDSVFPADIDSYASIAANSLRTTAKDYAKFILEWMNDIKLSKYLTTPVVKLTRDGWARAVEIKDERLKNLAWGYGLGLQLEQGEVTAVFHNGDMNQWRAVLTMNPKTKTGAVFFSNSHNGDVLTSEMTKGIIDARASCDYMRDKFGFAMEVETNWEANQFNRMKKIDTYIFEKNIEAANLNSNLVEESSQKPEHQSSYSRMNEVLIQNSPKPVSEPGNKLLEGIRTQLPSFSVAEVNSFHQALAYYAEYCKTLDDENKRLLSNIFWKQIHLIGTPIIELNPEVQSECKVYFLFRKDDVDESKEKPKNKKDLYLQGDFHGYDDTSGRQRLCEYQNTGIMFLENSIQRDALVTYRFIQLEPSHRGKSQAEHHGLEIPDDYFPHEDCQAAKSNTKKKSSATRPTHDVTNVFWGYESKLIDANSRHRAEVLGIGSTQRIFKVNEVPGQAHIPESQSLDCAKKIPFDKWKDTSRNFIYHQTLYHQISSSDLAGKLIESNEILKEDAGPNDLFNPANEVYSNCTRVVHVFKPGSRKIDNLVVVNDGFPYLTAGVLDRFENMVNDRKLSANTAFVFVTPLPGLSKTMTIDDPKAALPGMGERVIDYEHGIDNYISFIKQQLLPMIQDSKSFEVNAGNRIMIGSSLSGNAALYAGLNHPELFGAVIVQSPSSSNRRILSDKVNSNASSSNASIIHLSCGIFEAPEFAGNDFLLYAKQLSQRLDYPALQITPHGHSFLGWAQDLERSLPEVIEQLHTNKLESETDKNESPSPFNKSN